MPGPLLTSPPLGPTAESPPVGAWELSRAPGEGRVVTADGLVADGVTTERPQGDGVDGLPTVTGFC